MPAWLPEPPLRLLALALCAGWVGWKLVVVGRWWKRQLLGEPLARAFRRELQRRGLTPHPPQPRRRPTISR